MGKRVQSLKLVILEITLIIIGVIGVLFGIIFLSDKDYLNGALLMIIGLAMSAIAGYILYSPRFNQKEKTLDADDERDEEENKDDEEKDEEGNRNDDQKDAQKNGEQDNYSPFLKRSERRAIKKARSRYTTNIILLFTIIAIAVFLVFYSIVASPYLIILWVAIEIIILIDFIKGWKIVPEGYGLMRMFLGAYRETKIIWQDHEVDAKSNIVPSNKKYLSGLVFVGFWPFWGVYTYDLDIVRLNSQGKPEPLKIKSTWKIRCKRDVYVFEFSVNMENPLRDAHGIPFGVTFTIPASVINGYDAFHKAERWSVVLTSVVETKLRPVVAHFVLDDIVDFRVGKDGEESQRNRGIVDASDNPLYKIGDDVMLAFEKALKEGLSNKADSITQDNTSQVDKGKVIIQGALVEIDSIGILGVVPSEEYLQRYQAKQKADALVVQTKGDQQRIEMLGDAQAKIIKKIADAKAYAEAKRGKGISDGLEARLTEFPLKALAKLRGVPEKEIQEKMATDQSLRDAYDKLVSTLTDIQAIDEKQYRKFANDNGKEVGQLAIAADTFVNKFGGPNTADTTPPGNADNIAKKIVDSVTNETRQTKERSRSSGSKKRISDMTPEERKKYLSTPGSGNKSQNRNEEDYDEEDE